MKTIEFNNADDDFKTNVGHIQECMKGPAIVLVWAVWCPHCTTMKGEWEKLKQSQGSKVHFVEIESTNLDKIRSGHKTLFKKLYAQPDRVSYPTIKFIKNSKGTVYENPRTYEDMKKHAEVFFKSTNAKKTATKPKTASTKKTTPQKGGNSTLMTEKRAFQKELSNYIKGVLSKL